MTAGFLRKSERESAETWPHREGCAVPDDLSRIANALSTPADMGALREFGERCALAAMREVNNPQRYEVDATRVAAEVVDRVAKGGGE